MGNACCKSQELTKKPELEVSQDEVRENDLKTQNVNAEETSTEFLHQNSHIETSLEDANPDKYSSHSTRPTGLTLPELATERADEMLREVTSREIEVVRLKNGGKAIDELREFWSPSITKDNEVFIGELNTDFMRDGYGILYCESHLYEGYWRAERLNGKGMLIKDNLEVYKGRFRKGELSKGTLQTPSGYSYKGEFKNFLQTGHGEERKSDGSVYVGAFAEGVRHGLGKVVFQDKSWFDGRFDGGNRVEGVFMFSNGSKYTGTWKQNKMHGTGKLMLIDGTVYMGQFMNGKKHGEGKLLKENGVVVIGNWSEDKLLSESYMQDAIGRTRQVK